MGRTAIALGTKDGDPYVMDRLASGFFSADEGPTGNPSFGAARTSSVLQHTGGLGDETHSPENATNAETEIIPPELWSQLSLSERQRFGHRFSFMVLKALGLRPCQLKEVEV